MTVVEPLALGSPEGATPGGSGGASGQYPALLVRAGSRLCALPVQHVVETFRPLPVDPVSGAPSFVRGMAVVRGEPVPVLDLGSLLGDPEQADPARFVTLRVGARRVALAVEAVLGVSEIETGLLRDVPPLLQEAQGERVAAVAILDEELLLVLRAARLVPDELWETLASALSSAGNGRPAASEDPSRLGDGPPRTAETVGTVSPERKARP